jgi:hypothetical protein
MRKISLDVSALRVESFDTLDDKAKVRGTVQGYYTQITCPATQCGNQCPSGPSPWCDQSRAWTNGYDGCLCATILDCAV